jgi:hypothetical protein
MSYMALAWALIAEVGPEATKRFFEFFTVPIRNRNTRMAYYHAIGQFLDWCQRCGFRHLEDIEPITVAAYIEQHSGSPATIKQDMARYKDDVFMADRERCIGHEPGTRGQDAEIFADGRQDTGAVGRRSSETD